MLALFSMALFVVPAPKEAEAQSGATRNTIVVCFNGAGGAVTFTDSIANCPTGTYKQALVYQRAEAGVCVYKTNNPDPEEPTHVIKGPGTSKYSVDDKGNRIDKVCKSDTGTTTGTFTSFPPVTTITPINPGPGTGTNPNTKPPVTPGGTITPGGSSTPDVPCGDSDGFRKLGPLCVPNNPFSKDSIAGGDLTATSLAIRIIRILLYFAAIVSVIMIIIGGYYVMTAQGNESQASTGKKTLINALIGLGITILAYLIVQVVVNFITK